jgi:hypothetical protein
LLCFLAQDDLGGFQDLEYCKTDLIAPKGVVFCKFTKASSALKALEDITERGSVRFKIPWGRSLRSGSSADFALFDFLSGGWLQGQVYASRAEDKAWTFGNVTRLNLLANQRKALITFNIIQDGIRISTHWV